MPDQSFRTARNNALADRFAKKAVLAFNVGDPLKAFHNISRAVLLESYTALRNGKDDVTRERDFRTLAVTYGVAAGVPERLYKESIPVQITDDLFLEVDDLVSPAPWAGFRFIKG